MARRELQYPAYINEPLYKVRYNTLTQGTVTPQHALVDSTLSRFNVFSKLLIGWRYNQSSGHHKEESILRTYFFPHFFSQHKMLSASTTSPTALPTREGNRGRPDVAIGCPPATQHAPRVRDLGEVCVAEDQPARLTWPRCMFDDKPRSKWSLCELCGLSRRQTLAGGKESLLEKCQTA